MCLDTTVLAWGHKLREQDAGVLVVFHAARPEREDSKDAHWRQPLTSDSQAFVPEMTNLHHPIGRATDIRTRQVIYTWPVVTGTRYNIVGSNLLAKRSKKFSSRCLWAAGSIPCAASSATTWVNQPTLMDNRRLCIR